MSPTDDTARFSLSSNPEYSTGKYGGTSSTDFLYVPLTAAYTSGAYIFNVTVPYISVTSADHNVLPNVGRMGSGSAAGAGAGMGGAGMGGGMGNGASTQTTQAGLGDVMASMGYDFYRGQNLGLTLFGGVKFGTANSNKGLGTGRNDYSAEIDSAYAMHDTTLLAAIGYKVVGKTAAYVLNNIAYASLGINQRIGAQQRASLMLSGAQRSNPFGANRLALAAGWSHQFGEAATWSVSLSKGLASGSPDWGGALGISSNF